MTVTMGKTAPISGLFDRYPGPKSFQDNDVDRQLFFGREQEIEHLLHRIRAVRVFVLFGKSGLGKTSLLQAGLFPRLRDHGLLPVPVRLNESGVEPVTAVFTALREECEKRQVECPGTDTEGLWEFFKATDLWRGELLMMPVLVFDQFEELFTLQSESVCAAVAAQLGELAVRGLPARIRDRGQDGIHPRYTDTPPDVKVILSLREEYVGALEDLAPNLPSIFEQRFRLAPLSKKDAMRAVVEPAAIDNSGLFATPPFQYAKPALDGMMDFLANRKGEVEPFQLQIICRRAEQQVAKCQKEREGVIEVDESLLGGRKAMEHLLEDFYRQAIYMLPNGWQRVRARKLCELGLLNPDGHRVSLHEAQIAKQYNVSNLSLETLTKARLIRKDARPDLKGFYYELTHDSVARAVNRSRRFRVPTPVKMFGLLTLSGLITLIGGMLWLWGYSFEQAALKVQSLFVSINLEPQMVSIPGGTFLQGDVEKLGEPWRNPVREVTIQPFAMGQYEITFEEYDRFAIATDNPLPHDQGWGRGRRPVINISWEEARKYADWLSKATGKSYRLPTESEWEYAARSGSNQEVWAGTSDKAQLNDYAVYGENSGNRTALVGSKQANSFKLYDLSGNVFEWVKDCLHEDYHGAPKDGSAWLEERGGDCTIRVLRGGSWNGDPVFLRSSNRLTFNVDFRSSGLGFRLAQDTP